MSNSMNKTLAVVMVATVMLATIAALVVVDITSANAQVRLREHPNCESNSGYAQGEPLHRCPALAK